MIRLYYSNRSERLVGALAENLRARRAARSPLDPISILVPNQATTAYLKLAVAAQLGIAANLRFEFLRSFLSRLVEETGVARVANAATFELLVLRVLLDASRLADPELGPVADYLAAAGTDEDARDLRRVQLARELGLLFDEYALSRHDLLKQWRNGCCVTDPLHAAVERWERALWLALQGEDGALGPTPAAGAPLSLTLGAAFERGLPISLPSELHLFDVSFGAPALSAVIAQIAQRTDVFLYALNPCLEFWEDLRTGSAARAWIDRLSPRHEPRRGPSEDPYGLLGGADTPALRLWGRPGREHIRLLDDLTQCDFVECFEAAPERPQTVLEQLRRDILVREPERTKPVEPPPLAGDADDSVVVFECPGIRRECEAIAAEIWTVMSRDTARTDGVRPLALTDVAVVLAGRDQDLYRAHLSAVFDELSSTPCCFLDVPLASSSRVLELVELLLSLPGSSFTRRDLLRVVTHPCVLARFADASADEWLSWCDGLGVVHGADHRDHADTYIERDLYNWDQGLKRLVLGTFMAGEKSGETRSYGDGAQDYLPFEYPADRLASAARLVVVVRSLIADARYAEGARLPLSGWAELWRLIVSAYVTPASEQDERDLLRCLGAIHGLAEHDPGLGPVSVRIAVDLLRQRLSGMASNSGQPLAGGVVVAPLSLVASIPFRMVFIAGLGEGRFPSSDRKSQLDLRAVERRPGDVSPRERDQWAFLTRVLATTERLRLSYVSRNAQTGDPLSPSPTMLELLHILERGYLGPAGAKRIVRRYPLRRHEGDDTDVTRWSVAALREQRTLQLRQDLRGHLGPDADIPDLDTLRRGLSAVTRTSVEQRLLLQDPPPSAPDTSVDAKIVPFAALKRFLEDPLQGWAKYVLELREDDLEADPYAREHELFQTEELDRHRLLTDVFLAHALARARGEGVELEALYDARAKRMELSGRLPTGVFAAAERKRHLEVLNAWRLQVRRLLAGRHAALEPLRFGHAQEHLQIAEVEEPLMMEVSGRRVELHGSTSPLTEDPRASLVLIPSAMPKGVMAWRHELGGFLDEVVLAAMGRGDPGGHEVFVAYSESQERRVKLAPFTRDEATTYLRALLEELLSSRSHAYALPFTTVVELRMARNASRSKQEEILAKAKPTRFGPLARPEVESPELDEALEIARRRFEPFFARRTGPED